MIPADLEKQYYHASAYLYSNGFSEFRLYYGKEEDRALFMLPVQVLPQNPDLRSRSLIIDLASLQRSDGRTVEGTVDGSRALLSLANVDELLAHGSRLIYFADYLQAFAAGDFVSFTSEPEALFERLVAAGILYADGIFSRRARKRVERMEKGELAELTGLPDPAALQTFLAGQEKAAYAQFQLPCGLFFYNREKIEYCAALNRGEHQVFFEAIVGARYGVFTPYSFLGLRPEAMDPAFSQKIFERLKDRGILEPEGHLVADRIPSLKEEDCDGLYLSVRSILLDARSFSLKDLLQALEQGGERLRVEIENSGHSKASVQEFLSQLSPAETRRAIRLYQEQMIRRDVGQLILERRGIVLGAKNGEYLLLLTDAPLLTIPFYARLLAEFSRLLSGPVFLAHAYTHPPPRGEQKEQPHPLAAMLTTLFLFQDQP